ncbi:PREDICTED: myeloid-associated differentiation marker-like [Nanorana parkeri]|uniref:myeloid-associated differentiation marker-like n=1 Tax=Nanorana parkeri TaxID=125878 RepID=UPI000854F334|nr:PREDICTED: myeloid-associated differentiation marker-like [Nanorana parkeri]
MNLRYLLTPLVALRFFQIFLSCTAFSLVASVGMYHSPYGAWSMLTWILCFVVTILIVVLELTGFYNKVPISWEDFTSAFSMLASLMLLTTSIMYPSVYLKGGCSGHTCACMGSATAMSILCFFAYAIEVGLTRAKPGEISGFLSTVPGLLKVFESYVACIIFSLLVSYNFSPGLQWCVAVYSICFIVTTIIIILTIGRLLPRLPINFEKILIGYNILAVAMYITVAVIWPYYFFNRYSSRNCSAGYVCEWDTGVGVTILTYINLVAYIVDTIYSFRMVFFTVPA